MMWKWPEMNFYAGELRVKMRYSVFHTQLHRDSRQIYRHLDVSCTIVEILWLAECLVLRKLGLEVTKRRGVSKRRPVLWSSSGHRVPACIHVVFFCRRVRYLLLNLMSHVCWDHSNGSFTICIHTNSYGTIAYPLLKYCVEILILQWDHSKLSTCKSPHTSIWGGDMKHETGGLTQIYTTKWNAINVLDIPTINCCTNCIQYVVATIYRQTSNISRTSVSNKIQFEHGLSALLQLHLNYRLNIWQQWIGQRKLQDETTITHIFGLGATYIRYFTVLRFMAIQTPDTSYENGSWNCCCTCYHRRADLVTYWNIIVICSWLQLDW